MRMATRKDGAAETACIVTEAGTIPIHAVNRAEGKRWPVQVLDIIAAGALEDIRAWYDAADPERLAALTDSSDAEYAPLYRHPRKIWGIGFNYAADEAELRRTPADAEPVGFMKPDTTIIGHREAIRIPRQSERTVAEAELAVVIGKRCKDVDAAEALGVIAGYTTAIDVSADDIHQKNPRFLTRAKSFDTFCGFGPVLVTPDEIDDVSALRVSTVLNGSVAHQNRIAHMRYPPCWIVAFHSAVMTLLPGDVILSGTPGAVVIRDGDVVECRIDGFEPLMNRVSRY